MIAAAESFSDVLERLARHIAAEIHDDLAWEYEFFTSFLADEIKGCDAEMLRNYINNKLRSHFAGSVREIRSFNASSASSRLDFLII